MSIQTDPMFHLFQRTPDLVCIVDKAGWFKKINPAVIKTLDYSEEELFACSVAEFIHPEDREITAKRRSDLLNNKPLLNFQNRYLTKSGNVVWLEWTSVYIPEEELVFAIAKDITPHKTVELEIEENYKKYKDLVTHFKHNVEKDREYFAVQLHEQLAQLATVVRMHFESVAQLCSGTDIDLVKAIEDGLTSSELLINKIRSLSYSMSPAPVQDLGLDTVLHSLCNEFSSLTKIPCTYESFFSEEHLDYEIQLDLLRICQEALLNVMNHAEATEVRIKIDEKENKVELSITDNGKGFEHKSRRSFGLKNMEGRALSINGELLIESKESIGTTVSVSVDKKIKRLDVAGVWP
jgi:PAS domain S-box-containing protein